MRLCAVRIMDDAVRRDRPTLRQRVHVGFERRVVKEHFETKAVTELGYR